MDIQRLMNLLKYLINSDDELKQLKFTSETIKDYLLYIVMNHLIQYIIFYLIIFQNYLSMNGRNIIH